MLYTVYCFCFESFAFNKRDDDDDDDDGVLMC